MVDAILASRQFDPASVHIFVENARFAKLFQDFSCTVIDDTRLVGRKNIPGNLKLVMAQIGSHMTLWVSDILWPMNNAVYTAMWQGDKLEHVNFFDEGIVLYWQERLSLFSSIRERAKFVILALRLGVRFTTPAARPFYDNRKNGATYALHPELLSHTDNVIALDIDLARTVALVKKMEAERTGKEKSVINIAENAALVLSQPYYRVADADEFKHKIGGLARLLRERGHEQLFVKPHPSEGEDIFNRFYRDEGFEIAYGDLVSPVEGIVQHLRPSCTLASFNSSALLNARKFGFRGHILSYGLNWVAAQYPMQRNLQRLNHSLFLRGNLEVVLA